MEGMRVVFRDLIIGTILFIYLLVGAYIFHILESDNYKDIKEEVNRDAIKFRCKSSNFHNADESFLVLL